MADPKLSVVRGEGIDMSMVRNRILRYLIDTDANPQTIEAIRAATQLPIERVADALVQLVQKGDVSPIHRISSAAEYSIPLIRIVAVIADIALLEPGMLGDHQ